MSAIDEERLARLEDRMLWLQKRLERLEGRLAAEAPEEKPQVAVAPPPAPRPAPAPVARPVRQAPKRDLEELLGGCLLALVGGVAVLVGLAFLVALAVPRGWLDEKGRTALAFFCSAGPLRPRGWLRQETGPTPTALPAA